MREWGVAESKAKLVVVVCEPLAQIRKVDPSQYPWASPVLAYLDMGGQVIFAEGSGGLPETGECEDVTAEIR